tara:strand:+ start:240 stop:2135 length:1896 start_codon:yes stop_codon:yes gene_type:complete
MPAKGGNMPSDLTVCTLQIPSARTVCTQWIQQQAPSVIADVLGMSESMYNSMTLGIYTDETARERFDARLASQEKHLQLSLEKALTKENERVTNMQYAHDAIVERYKTRVGDMEVELQNAKSGWSMSLKEEVEKQQKKITDELSEKEVQSTRKFTDTIELLHAKLQSQEEHAKRLREQYTDSFDTKEMFLKTQHATELNTVKEQYVQQVEETRRLQGANALFKENVGKEFESKLDECKDQHAAHKERAEQQLQTELQRHAGERDFLRKQVQDKDGEIKHLREHGARVLEEKTNEITNVIRNITGSTTAVGKFGETFVNDVHAQMELGTYSDDAHIKQHGFADGTWELTFPSQSVEKLVCMADVKYGFPDKPATQLHSQKDVKKFEDDTRAGVQMGRINCSMLISLVKRIPGRPRLSMDNYLGVPTVWVSRDAEDAIPARALIEMGFLMLAQAWPIISKRHNDETNINDILQAVANNLECQMIEYEKQEKHIKTIEESAHRQLRNVAELRKVHATLMQNAQSFRIRYPAINAPTSIASPQDFWDAEGQTLLQAIKTHRATKGRNRYYPKEIDELHLPTDVLDVVRNIPNAFMLATNKVKDEMQETKRTVQSSSGGEAKRQKASENPEDEMTS